MPSTPGSAPTFSFQPANASHNGLVSTPPKSEMTARIWVMRRPARARARGAGRWPRRRGLPHGQPGDASAVASLHEPGHRGGVHVEALERERGARGDAAEGTARK